MKRLSVVLSGEIESTFLARSQRLGQSYSELIREALVDYLKLEGDRA